MENHEFTKNLIKGRIAETIFEQMFRESGKLTILKFGYENTSPELAQFQHHLKNKKILDKIRHAPDFLLITEDKTGAYFVEVKFISTIHQTEIKKIAQQVLDQADPSYLFVATPKGFFFDPCNTIVNHDGAISELKEDWIPLPTQREYLELLNMFELRN